MNERHSIPEGRRCWQALRRGRDFQVFLVTCRHLLKPRGFVVEWLSHRVATGRRQRRANRASNASTFDLGASETSSFSCAAAGFDDGDSTIASLRLASDCCASRAPARIAIRDVSFASVGGIDTSGDR
jgi:hypothetical protein